MDVGGQAVIEGIMMRNKERFAIAVRLPNGNIKIRKEKTAPLPTILNKFFIRGIVGLSYTLYDGVRALIWSSNQNLGVDEKLSKKEAIGTVTLSFFVSAIVFVLIPFLSAKYIAPAGVWFDLVDGLFRVGFFIGYLLLISMMSDVKTLFQYHGAEHKVIYCYEQGWKLTPRNVKKFTRFHPRCGTTFIFIVLLLSIFFFALIPGNFVVKFLGRLFLLPVIAGFGYELIKLSCRYHKNTLVKLLITPGLWLQRITTKEPTTKQLEVGIASLKAVLNSEKL